MAEALITGATGFIGSHLVDALLARGDRVTCLVRTSSRIDRLRSLGVTLAVGDVEDPQSLRRAVAGTSVVYHLAGCLEPFRKRQFYAVNERGFDNIARACAEQREPPVLVLVSSVAAAGPSRGGQPLRESDPATPVSHYGRSKRAGELAAARLADRVPITIVRPGGVFGQRDRKVLAIVRPVVRFGVHCVPVWPRLGISLIHAQDLVELLIRAAEQGARIPSPGSRESQAGRGIYFAACNERPTYRELGKLIGQAVGRRRVRTLPMPAPVIWVGAAGEECSSRLRRRPAQLSFDKAREATAGTWFCSTEAACRELGFRVLVPLAERIRQTCLWYREQGWL